MKIIGMSTNYLPKQMEFNKANQSFISSFEVHRNKIPRKSLNYKTSLRMYQKMNRVGLH